MSTGLFEEQRAAVRAAVATGLGCTEGDLQREGLMVVDRPPSAAWRYVAYAATFGVGAVVSVDPAYRPVAEAAAPTQPSHALRPAFRRVLAEEAQRRGCGQTGHFAAINWALATLPAPAATPAGFTLCVEDASWMRAEMPSGRWPNGLGQGPDGEMHERSARNRYAVVLRDAQGNLAAIGGVHRTFGLSEIGVDVAPEFQGQGLGSFLLPAATRVVLERGETPFYACATENIRAQRTALASGFQPAFTGAGVVC